MTEFNPGLFQGKDRLALLVGIDDYLGQGLNKLGGCVNDIDSLAGVLALSFDFTVVCLKNGEATRERILEAMQSLLDIAKKDDQIVFAWCGHGARLCPKKGPVFETLVPCDSSRGSWDGNRDITDRELFRWVWQISEKTRFLTLIIDACQSGSIVRDYQAKARGAAGDTGDNPSIEKDKNAFNTIRAQGVRAGSGKSGWLPLSDRYTLLAACLSTEFCREFEDRETGLKRGLFSWHLHRAMIDLKNKVTWRDLFEEVAAAVTLANKEQHPQLEGGMDLAIFGKGTYKPTLYIPVRSSQGSRIFLNGGAVHGVRLGSQWALASAVSRRAEEAHNGEIRIDVVGATQSEGLLLGPPEPRLGYSGMRAFETSRPIDSRFRVLLDSSAGDDAELLSLLEKSSFLILGQGKDGEKADLVLHRLAPRQSCSPGDPLPQVPVIETASWAFLDTQSGVQLAPLLPAGRGVSRERVVQTLEKLARHRFLSRMTHPDPSVAAHHTVEIEAFRLLENEDGEKPQEVALAEDAVLRSGDRIAFRLTHANPKPLQVTLIGLGLTGSVDMLFPPVQGRYEPFAAGATLSIGFQEADALEICLPEIYPFPGEEAPEIADDHLLFLFTEQLTRNLELMAQDGLRSRAPKASPVGLALEMASGAEIQRSGTAPDALQDRDSWGLQHWRFRLATRRGSAPLAAQHLE